MMETHKLEYKGKNYTQFSIPKDMTVSELIKCLKELDADTPICLNTYGNEDFTDIGTIETLTHWDGGYVNDVGNVVNEPCYYLM